MHGIDFTEKNIFFSKGFVVSSACDNERTATYMAMGSFLPIVMLCGIIWPIEGMYPGLKFIALFVSRFEIHQTKMVFVFVIQMSRHSFLLLATAYQIN